MTDDPRLAGARAWRDRSWRWWLAMLVAMVVPVVPLVAVVLASTTPAPVTNTSVDLGDSWTLTEGAIAPLFDAEPPRESRSLRLRETTRTALSTTEFWATHSFDTGPKAPVESWYLLMRPAAARSLEVYVNDAYVGTEEPRIFAGAGFELPARLLRSGQNVLALHARWDPYLSRLVNFSSVARVGPRRVLGPYFAAQQRLYFLGIDGALGVCLVVIPMLLALMASAGDRRERLRYALTACFSAATAGQLGFYFEAWRGLPPAGACVYPGVSVLLVALAAIEWIAHEAQAPLTWARRILRPCLAVGVLALLVLPEHAVGLLRAARLGALIAILYASGLQLRHMARRPDPTTMLVTAALIDSTVVAVWRLLYLTNVVSLDSPDILIAYWDLDLAALVAVFSHFVQVSRKNLVLSSSLATTNGELTQALSEAREVTRLKGEFLANVSHELRTPLNSIINIPEGLLEDFVEVRFFTCGACRASFEPETTEERLAPDARCPDCAADALSEKARVVFCGDAAATATHLQGLRSASTHLLAVVNDVLDFSKLEAGKMTFHFEPVAVAGVLTDLAATVAPLAAAKNVAVRLPASTPWSLRADRVKLLQVLINLVANAIKFSPSGAEIEVLVEAAPEGDTLILRVRDRGPGIPAEQHGIIFESFRQADGSHTRRHGGTGLGLAIVREVVMRHGGTVGVESEVGRGSTFIVRLPFDGPPAVTRGASGRGTASPEAKRDGVVVVVVDDEPLAIDTARIALRALGCRVVGVTDARDALEVCARERPVVVLLDVMMPRLSGVQLLRALRADARTRDLAVIVSTAYDDNREVAAAHGADWVPKPWSSTELRDRVAERLRETGREVIA